MPAVRQARRGLHPRPDEGRLVRLHVGLEEPGYLIGDLAAALEGKILEMAGLIESLRQQREEG